MGRGDRSRDVRGERRAARATTAVGGPENVPSATEDCRRHDVRHDVFDGIEMSHNPRRRHSASGDLSPEEIEWRDARQEP